MVVTTVVLLCSQVVSPTSHLLFEGVHGPSRTPECADQAVTVLTLHKGVLYSGSADGWVHVWRCCP